MCLEIGCNGATISYLSVCNSWAGVQFYSHVQRVWFRAIGHDCIGKSAFRLIRIRSITSSAGAPHPRVFHIELAISVMTSRSAAARHA